MIAYILVYLALILWIVYLLFPFKELFTNNAPNFIEEDNAEFRGINLLGDNSDDTHFAAGSASVCRDVCQRNPECKGYSYYQPGQRCYMFMSGDFVNGRPGFYSGKKLGN